MTDTTIQQEIKDKTSVLAFRNSEKVEQSFLLIAENKKGKLIALSASIDNEGDIDLFGITKGQYKAIRSIKKEALLNNPKIKAIYGNSTAAEDMRAYISNEINQKQTVEIAEDIKNGSNQDVGEDIDNFLISKMEQKIEDQKKVISEENMNKLNNKASLLYKSDNGYKFVSVKKEGDKYFLERTEKYLTEEEILKNTNIKGVYGNSELAKSLKDLFKNVKQHIGMSNKEDVEDTIDEIKGFFENRDNKKKKKRSRGM